MNTDICQYDANIDFAQIVSSLNLRDEICETHEQVVEENDCAFIEYFNQVGELRVHRFEPHDENDGREADEILGGKL